MYENIPFRNIENIVESLATRPQRCIDLEGNRAGFSFLFNYFFFKFKI